MFDNQIKQAIAKAGQFNSVVDGVVVDGIIHRHKGGIQFDTTRPPLNANEFQATAKQDNKKSFEINLATKTNFIYEIPKQNQSDPSQYISVKFKDADVSLKGSVLTLPKNGTTQQHVEAIKTAVSDLRNKLSGEAKEVQAEPKKQSDLPDNASSPSQVKASLGNMDQQIGNIIKTSQMTPSLEKLLGAKYEPLNQNAPKPEPQKAKKREHDNDFDIGM